MRIISGIRRGHKLLEIENAPIRPTSDRVKESIFNLIQMHFPCRMVLDLFCGSGALAFEALSRGAEYAVCVDSDKRSISVTAQNAKNLRFTESVEIINTTAEHYLNAAAKQFDVIFLDPPYNKGYIKPTLFTIAEKNILTDSGIVVLESDNTDEHGQLPGLTVLKQKRYGRTYVTIYNKGD